jgi:hypothetical protein
MEKEDRIYSAECECGELFDLDITDEYYEIPLEEAIYSMIDNKEKEVLCKKCGNID